RRRLDTVLLLLLRLHITLFPCRAAEELLGLLLAKATLRLWSLVLRLVVRAAAATTAAATAALLLLSQRELVIPLRVEIGRAHEHHLLVDRQGRVEAAVVLSCRRGEPLLEMREADVEQHAIAQLFGLGIRQTSKGLEGTLVGVGGDERRAEVV